MQAAQHAELIVIPSSISPHNFSWRFSVVLAFLFILNQSQCRISPLKGRVKVNASSSTHELLIGDIGVGAFDLVGAAAMGEAVASTTVGMNALHNFRNLL